MLPSFILSVIKDKTEGIIDKIGISSYFLLGFFNVIYFSALLGIVFFNQQYINTFKIAVHTLLCFFLLYRFRPWQKTVEIKHYDQVIIFSSAVFLLLNLGIVEFIKNVYTNGSGVLNIFANNTKSSS
jgi:hypothetical protein